MKKEVIVMSLGGSLIAPEKRNPSYLNKFKKTIQKFYKKYKFVIVCGGGSIARNYIETLKKGKATEKELSLAGIEATRMNARFLMQLFGKIANDTLPLDMLHVKTNLRKNNLVICGALRYTPHATSDTTAAKLAHYFKSPFINITNVKGLYTSNPLINKNAKFIPKISAEEFEKKALSLKYKHGQHFILDQKSSVLIRKFKIKTYIIGPSLSNLRKLLQGKKFVGTVIQ